MWLVKTSFLLARVLESSQRLRSSDYTLLPWIILLLTPNTKSGKCIHYLFSLIKITSSIFVRLKSSAEQQFLYGHNVTKAGLGRITENTEKYTGVIVYSMSDLPLGFGVAAKSTSDCRHADPMAIVCFHQVFNLFVK